MFEIYLEYDIKFNSMKYNGRAEGPYHCFLQHLERQKHLLMKVLCFNFGKMCKS